MGGQDEWHYSRLPYIPSPLKSILSHTPWTFENPMLVCSKFDPITHIFLIPHIPCTSRQHKPYVLVLLCTKISNFEKLRHDSETGITIFGYCGMLGRICQWATWTVHAFLFHIMERHPWFRTLNASCWDALKPVWQLSRELKRRAIEEAQPPTCFSYFRRKAHFCQRKGVAWQWWSCWQSPHCREGLKLRVKHEL